ncbi:hypothetical protein EMCRGX_G009352 [Ephydatia muelleri]
MFGDERFKRYGCSEPGYYFRKGMVVQQDFEKGHYKWRSRQDGGDAHLSDGDRLATLDVFPLMGIDLFKMPTSPMGINWRCLMCSH